MYAQLFGMIVGVSLRLLYLLFLQVLGLVLQMGRTSSTKDLEVLVLRAARGRRVPPHQLGVVGAAVSPFQFDQPARMRV